VDVHKVWLNANDHTIPMVCFGCSNDHIVFSPQRAKEIGESFIAAYEEAVSLISKRVDAALLEKEKERGDSVEGQG
jgi:hypothetical protein